MNDFTGKFPKIFITAMFFEMLMDGCSKNSNNLVSGKPVDAREWMKRRS